MRPNEPDQPKPNLTKILILNQLNPILDPKGRIGYNIFIKLFVLAHETLYFLYHYVPTNSFLIKVGGFHHIDRRKRSATFITVKAYFRKYQKAGVSEKILNWHSHSLSVLNFDSFGLVNKNGCKGQHFNADLS